MFTSQTRLTLLSYRHTVGAAERQTRRQLEPILTEAGPENKRTHVDNSSPLLSSSEVSRLEGRPVVAPVVTGRVNLVSNCSSFLLPEI